MNQFQKSAPCPLCVYGEREGQRERESERERGGGGRGGEGEREGGGRKSVVRYMCALTPSPPGKAVAMDPNVSVQTR